ncbi:MAG: CoA pyrophosphatase [Pseudomonadales bacterium]|nr:CoA pyrophosphatase [Pseudomonadales bacterium]
MKLDQPADHKLKVSLAQDSGIRANALAPDLNMIRACFQQTDRFPELRNPHIEHRVSASVRAQAKSSAVLIAIRAGESATVLVTKRQANIRFAGHICFPGGGTDADDGSDRVTALREAEEEIGLNPEDVEVLGCLGEYYTQTGYRIRPVIGIVGADAKVVSNPAEVASIYEISLARMLDPASYDLNWHNKDRAHFSISEQGIRIAGPTVSMMIGLVEALSLFANTRTS